MKRRRGRGVYLLPNLLTTASLFCGFYSIVATIDKKFIYACVAIFLSCLFDALDGRVARMTGSTSKFGVEYAVIRKDVFDSVGRFDERFFMFYEDVDLGWRLNLLG